MIRWQGRQDRKLRPRPKLIHQTAHPMTGRAEEVGAIRQYDDAMIRASCKQIGELFHAEIRPVLVDMPKPARIALILKAFDIDFVLCEQLEQQVSERTHDVV